MLTKFSKMLLALSLVFVMSTQVMSSSKRNEEVREEAIEESEPNKRRRLAPVPQPKNKVTTSRSSSSSSSSSAHRNESKEEKRDEEEPSTSSSSSSSSSSSHDSRNHHITKLDLSRDKDLTDISFLRFFPALRELNLSNCYNLGDSYQPISQLTTLVSLNLYETGLTKPRYIKTLVNLTYLKMWCSDLPKAMKYISHLPKLRELDIGGNKFEGLEKISQLTTLDTLILRGFFNDGYEEEESEFPSLDFISHLINLKKLRLSGNNYSFAIKPIVKLPRLTDLDLSGCYCIKDLRKLKKLTSLVHLDLSHINSFYMPTLEKDLSALTKLAELRSLTVSPRVKVPTFPDSVRINR